MTTPKAENCCTVCRETLDSENRARCIMCGGLFHQQWQQERDVPQCGQALSHQEAMGLVYVCENCYDLIPEEGAY